MPRFEWEVSIGAALLFPLLYFLDDHGVFAAALPAILFHELGHCAAVRLCGGRIVSLRLDTAGFLLTATPLPPREAVLSALAGPCLGFLWAAAAGNMKGAFWQESARVAYFLNTLNLLPALPLDGGQVLCRSNTGGDVLRITTPIVAALFAGAALLLHSILPLFPVIAMLQALNRFEEAL